MVVIYHRNTPLPKVRKGLDSYRRERDGEAREKGIKVRPMVDDGER
jgi:hypothetical protein